MSVRSCRKLCLLVSVVHALIASGDGGALSVFEQMKYKTLTDGQGLYSAADDVDVLTAENFKREVYGGGRATLVEFYNSWCGFCQRFAPSWKALASDVKGWRDLVAIAAIDCSDDANNPICRDFEIMAYPTLKYFHEGYEEGPGNLGSLVSAGSNVTEHKRMLLETIAQEQTQGRGKQYPDLSPYLHLDLSHIFDSIPDSTEYAFLFIQNPDDLTAQEIAMDLHEAKVVVRHANENNTALLKLLKPAVVPALYVVDRSYRFRQLSVAGKGKGAYRTVMGDFLKPRNVVVPDGGEEKEVYRGEWAKEGTDMSSFIRERERIALKERIKKMGDVVFQMDLETTLRYSLKHEVASSKEISGEKLVALKNYLNVLVKYFPFGKFGRLFLIELRDFVGSRPTVRGDELLGIIADAERDERQVFSSAADWLACKGSSSSYRGYPCGLWKLFHYLTVNAADQSVGLRGSNHKVVLEAMHGYVKHFFGCADCSRHFQEMARRRDLSGVTSWDDSILWLWMAHNEVNKRLSGDLTEDPEYPKYQFPSKERCAGCYDKDDSWNVAEVLRYLKHVYNGINVRYIGSDTRILHLGLDGSTVYNSESSLIRRIDAGMCFALYLASFLLIVVLIRMFLKRGYRKKVYHHSLLGKV